MGVTLTQSNHANGTGISTLNVSLTGAVGAGDLIILDVNWGSATGTYAASDGAGNTYTAHGNGPIVASNAAHMFWAICTNAQSSLTLTMTITGGGTHTLRLAAFDYNSTSGWQGTPFDVGSSGTGSAVLTGGASNITPAAAGELVHSVIQWGNATATSITVTAPYSEAVAGGTTGSGWIADGRADSGDNTSCASGAQTCTFNWTGSSNFSALIAAFKPAASSTFVPEDPFWLAPIFNYPEDIISVF